MGDALNAADSLQRAYPDRFDAVSAAGWLADRLDLLTRRVGPPTALDQAVSSGCALTGATGHARRLAEDAAHALLRWESGLGTECERCWGTLDFERLDSAPAAVRCGPCAQAAATPTDTKWCR